MQNNAPVIYAYADLDALLVGEKAGGQKAPLPGPGDEAAHGEAVKGQAKPLGTVCTSSTWRRSVSPAIPTESRSTGAASVSETANKAADFRPY